MSILEYINIVGLLAYLICIIGVVICIFISIRTYTGYSFKKHFVSNLGDSSNRSAQIYNTAIKIFGAMSLFLMLNMHRILPQTELTNIFIFAFSLVSVCTCLMGFLPSDKHSYLHAFLAVITFTIIFVFAIYFSQSIESGMLISTAVLQINYILIFSSISLFIVMVSDFWPIKIIFKSSFIDYKGLFEWICIIAAISWNLLVTIWILFTYINI